MQNLFFPLLYSHTLERSMQRYCGLPDVASYTSALREPSTITSLKSASRLATAAAYVYDT